MRKAFRPRQRRRSSNGSPLRSLTRPRASRKSAVAEARSRFQVAESAGLAGRHMPRGYVSSWSMLIRITKRLGRFGFQNGTFEKVRSSLAPKAQWIHEHELAKIFFADESVFYQLVGLLKHLVHVHY